ncbi:DUF2808 domain-containing protein [Anthocerotibacter panamensis]|uniref:DUF2808 domain-containing protein n=1 Tax=Anthocerotibacter panamensis TaxID=2857077 RepID=UPI001C402762|nr:DUF2808 domain-containing protein [Anthocerotibacter panamensis]
MNLLPRFVVMSLATSLLASPLCAAPVAFAGAVVLREALAYLPDVRYQPATYQFTVAIPVRVERPLARLTIAIPDDAGPFGVNLPRLQEVRVYTPSNPAGPGPYYVAHTLPVQVILEERTLVVNFPQPIAPGETVTVEFQQMRNPDQGGIYLFEINALPAGSEPVRQFVGYGRIAFRDSQSGR